MKAREQDNRKPPIKMGHRWGFRDMVNYSKLFGTVVIGAVLVFGALSGAEAATTSCTSAGFGGADISGKVTANAGCAVGSTNNDTLNPTLQVNDDGFFGLTDWQFAGKVIENASGIDIGLSITGTTLSGTWSIDDVWATYDSIMLVFKDGNGLPANFVGYLLVSGDTAGNYMTPFSNTINGNPKNISHISAYVSTSAVPIPAALPLLLTALAGLGFIGRRKLTSASA